MIKRNYDKTEFEIRNLEFAAKYKWKIVTTDNVDTSKSDEWVFSTNNILISYSPERIEFNNINQNDSSLITKNLIIHNSNTEAYLLLDTIYLKNKTSLFSLSFETPNIQKKMYPISFLPNQSMEIKISFNPKYLNLSIDTIFIGNNSTDNKLIKIPISANVILKKLNISSGSINYGKLSIPLFKDTSFSISNTGTEKISLKSIQLTGKDSSNFILKDYRLGDSIRFLPNENKIFSLRFKPLTAGKKDAALIMKFSDYNDISVSLSAEVIRNLPGTEGYQEKLYADVYPNPFKDILKILIETTKDKNIKIEIYDILGRRIFSKDIISKDDYFSYEINIRNEIPAINSGACFLIISDGSNKVSKKIIYIK